MVQPVAFSPIVLHHQKIRTTDTIGYNGKILFNLKTSLFYPGGILTYDRYPSAFVTLFFMEPIHPLHRDADPDDRNKCHCHAIESPRTFGLDKWS
jgi:hypothetical protein